VSQAPGGISSPKVTAKVSARRWTVEEAPMRVFVAGATGAIGTHLVPQLAAAGHDVIGMTRSPAKNDMLRALGARPVVADALDPDAVARAVAETEPEVIVHQLTALKGEPGLRDMRNPGRLAAMTNRLRTEGTDHLLAAGRAVGVRRFIAQSIVAIGTYARTGGPVKTEDDPLDLDLPAKLRPPHEAIRYVEDAVSGIDWAEGLVLRYGAFYGPGTGVSANPEALLTRAIRKRRFPIIGGGGGVWSFVHIEDAASATVAALDSGGPGIYNVVDDEPAPVREWLPFLAEQLGAKTPRGVPRVVVRLLAGEAAVLMMTEVRGGSNSKAKRVLGWQPRWSTWRVGFAKGLGG
jgi:2-alkyl-3-oxoalkanoate reductase